MVGEIGADLYARLLRSTQPRSRSNKWHASNSCVDAETIATYADQLSGKPPIHAHFAALPFDCSHTHFNYWIGRMRIDRFVKAVRTQRDGFSRVSKHRIKNGGTAYVRPDDRLRHSRGDGCSNGGAGYQRVLTDTPPQTLIGAADAKFGELAQGSPHWTFRKHIQSTARFFGEQTRPRQRRRDRLMLVDQMNRVRQI